MPTCGVGLLRDDLERRIVRLAIPALGTLAVEPMYVVTSMLMMSPSCSARESWIPWQITSLTLVHTLFGKWL